MGPSVIFLSVMLAICVVGIPTHLMIIHFRNKRQGERK